MRGRLDLSLTVLYNVKAFVPRLPMSNMGIRDRVSKEPPVRNLINRATESVPEGPLGNVGDGTVVGLLGFLAVESGEVITSPIPGLSRPGFKVVSHSMEQVEPGLQRHTIVLHAFIQDVAEFATKYQSAPSNFDFISGDIDVLSIEELDEQEGYDSYEIVVEVDRRPLD